MTVLMVVERRIVSREVAVVNFMAVCCIILFFSVLCKVAWCYSFTSVLEYQSFFFSCCTLICIIFYIMN